MTRALWPLALVIGACAEPPAAPQPPADPADATVPAASPAPSATATVLAPADGERLRFPDGREAVLKVTAEGVGAERLLLGTEALPAGTAIPVHAHDGYEEVLFVHEGRPLVTVGDATVRAEPGATVYVPAGAWHGVDAGEDAATVLFLFPDTGIADFFRAVGQAEGGPPPTLTGADWGRLMEQHRMRARGE